MALDFRDIDKEFIGYSLGYERNPSPGAQKVMPNVPIVSQLKFEDFIHPFSDKAYTYQHVYENLRNYLTVLVNQQNSVCNGKRSVFLDVLAKSTLDREATRNAMILIEEKYLRR